jgi:phage/plasmid-like protein (TIGR03299 family)
MAHELEIVNGVAKMAYAGDVPWHGLGTQVDPNLSPEEFMKVAGLDWEVEKVDNFIEYNGKKIYTGNKSLVRTSDSKILWAGVGPDWEPIQNAEAFNFFNDFVSSGDMTMETAGSLRGGQMVWAMAKVGENFEIFGGDKVEGYLLFSNPHMYGRTSIVDFVATRTVCANTLAVALNEKSRNRVTINHRQKFDPERVKALMGIASNQLTRFKEAALFLGSKKASDEATAEYFSSVFPITGGNKRGKEISVNAARAIDLVHEQPGADFAEGTWWQNFNAVTYMADHILSREDDTRLYNSWFGKVRELKIDALETAVEFAEKV